tara:strand:- start:361 stop:558 length:198 start_codon:yes stop_codon:yes gene_type:complete
VKKIDQIKKIVGTPSFSETENKIKTTNVNILLNRVRLDQKKDLKKKLVLFFLLATILSSLIVLVL